MNKTKKIIIFIILFLTIIFIKSNVYATSISITPSNPKVGDTVKVTITVPNVHTVDVTANVSGVASGKIQVVGGDLEGKAKNYSNSATYKCSKEGKISVSVSSDSTAVLDGKYVKVGASKSINVAKKQSSESSSNTNTSNSNNNSNNNSNITDSSDATLKNLGITPNDFSGFKKATTSYSVSVPYATEKISIYASAADSKAQVTGTGSKTLKEGNNLFSVKVTAQDKKTTKTYTINVTRKSKEEEKSTDATLRNLGITPREYDFTGFKMGTRNYAVEVPNDVEEIYVYGYATNENAKVTGLGAKDLKEGKNDFSVKVTAEDGQTTKTYTITVTRKTKEESENDKENEEEKGDEDKTNEDDKENTDNNKNSTTTKKGITSINIKGYDLKPEFSQDVYEYTLNLPEETKQLDINTGTSDKDVEVEIAGNESLGKGKNIITVLAHNKKEDTTTTYQINAIVGNEEAGLNQSNDELKKYQENMKRKKYIIIGVTAGIIILTIIFLIKRHQLKQDYEDYFSDNNEEETHYKNADLYKINITEQNEEKLGRGRYKGKRFK